METSGAESDWGGVLEEVAMGEEATLEAGDAAYIPGYTAGEIRNEGQEPAARLAILVLPPADMTGDATPAP